MNQPDGLDNLSYSYFNDGVLKTLGSDSGAAFTQWSYTYTKTRLPLTETLAPRVRHFQPEIAHFLPD